MQRNYNSYSSVHEGEGCSYNATSVIIAHPKNNISKRCNDLIKKSILIQFQYVINLLILITQLSHVNSHNCQYLAVDHFHTAKKEAIITTYLPQRPVIITNKSNLSYILIIMQVNRAFFAIRYRIQNSQRATHHSRLATWCFIWQVTLQIFTK